MTYKITVTVNINGTQIHRDLSAEKYEEAIATELVSKHAGEIAELIFDNIEVEPVDDFNPLKEIEKANARTF